MIEAIVGLLASVPAGVVGYWVGRAALRVPGRHEEGVSARRVCAEHGCPVERREVATHAA